ncbi:MAG: ROK family protein, partial [Myxococcota bacterium]|nr:ROK family protein [Myxococcota bacterium]
PSIQKHRPVSACFGVAGPVDETGRCVMTNLGWTLESAALEALLSIPVQLINDFRAQAEAIPALAQGEHVRLGGAQTWSPALPVAVIGAGTGLGEAYLIPSPAGGFLALSGEGGHARFAPRDALEAAHLERLKSLYGEHVSYERVVSGAGLVALYETLYQEHASEITGPPLQGGPAISAAALSSPPDPIASEALQRFIELLADEAANLCLKVNAGSLFISGGIAPQIEPLLRAHFARAFPKKGRYRNMLEKVYLGLVTHPTPGLLGAQVTAIRRFQERRERDG